MSDRAAVTLVVEDDLSEALITKLLREQSADWTVATTLGKSGVGYIRKRIRSFNQAAVHAPFFVLIDLDQSDCAPTLLNELLPSGPTAGMLARVAEREIESWVLADRRAVADLLGIRIDLVPLDPDRLPDPKKILTDLARRSRRKDVRDDLCPRPGSTAHVGRNYNGLLGKFVRERWSSREASERSPSLQRAIEAVRRFKPGKSFR